MATAAVEDVVACLITDFGSTNTVADIRDDALVFGQDGIDGFMQHVVYHVVDVMPSNSPTYLPLLAVLKEFCLTLAVRIEKYSKVQRPSRFFFS
jgi:hypothetical protein